MNKGRLDVTIRKKEQVDTAGRQMLLMKDEGLVYIRAVDGASAKGADIQGECEVSVRASEHRTTPTSDFRVTLP